MSNSLKSMSAGAEDQVRSSDHLGFDILMRWRNDLSNVLVTGFLLFVNA
jgi:hypothetical protein